MNNISNELKSHVDAYEEIMHIGSSIGSPTVMLKLRERTTEELKEIIFVSDIIESIKNFKIMKKELILGEATHFCFIGEGVDAADPICQEDIINLMQDISYEMLEFQKVTTNGKLNRLQPPFFELFTNGDYFFGKNTFYNYFNYIFVILNLSEKDRKPNFGALGELSNQPFSSFIVTLQNQDEYKIFKEQYIDSHFISVNPLRIHLIPGESATADFSSFLKEECMRYKYRFNTCIRS
jgi:hypothetical protein